MHVILTGATGLVGSGALAQALANMKGSGSSTISRLSILSRKPVPMAEGHPNVTVIQHSDFEKYPPEVLKQLEGAEACIWALGISQTQVGKEEYVKITKDYAIEAAKAFSTLNDPFKFVYVSGEGATHTPGALTPIFGRVKGETETALLALQRAGCPSLRAFSVRPAFVDKAGHAPVEQALAHRSKTAIDRLAAILGPPFRTFLPSHHSPTALLGDFLVRLATGDGAALKGDDVLEGGRVVPNRAMRRVMLTGE